MRNDHTRRAGRWSPPGASQDLRRSPMRRRRSSLPKRVLFVRRCGQGIPAGLQAGPGAAALGSGRPLRIDYEQLIPRDQPGQRVRRPWLFHQTYTVPSGRPRYRRIEPSAAPIPYHIRRCRRNPSRPLQATVSSTVRDASSQSDLAPSHASRRVRPGPRTGPPTTVDPEPAAAPYSLFSAASNARNTSVPLVGARAVFRDPGPSANRALPGRPYPLQSRRDPT